MTDDELFVSELRPKNVFGALGAMDAPEEQYGDMAEGWGVESNTMPLPTFDSAPAPGSPTVQMTEAALVPAPVAPAPKGSRMSAGLGLMFVISGALLGWHFGKFKGAAGGVLVAGAARNIYRAQRDMRSEAPDVRASSVRPGLIGLVGLGGGGYLLYTAAEGKKK